MSTLRICILGGTGFVGHALVARLAADGHNVIVLSRNPAMHSERLLPPGVLARQVDVYNPDELQTHFSGMDVAINLVGILNERGDSGRGFHHAHVELTQFVVSACRQAGVRRLLQMSALNAGRGRSHYLKTRGDAEAVVKASGLAWTIFEPSVIFGVGDGLFTRFGNLLRLTPLLPLARANTKFAPVFVGDVVEAFRRALSEPKSIGEVYELYGAEVFCLADLVRMTAQQLGLQRFVLPLPDALGRMQALAFDLIPGKPFSSDNFRSLLTDSVGGIDGLHRLGIVPTRVAPILPDILGHADAKQARYARYRAQHGE